MTMALGYQMIDGRSGACPVVQPDAAVSQLGQIAVDRNERWHMGGITEQQFVREASGMGNDRFAALIDQKLEAILFLLTLVRAVAHHQSETVLAANHLNTACQSGKEGIGQITCQQAKHIAAPLGQRDRRHIPTIVECAHRLLDAFPCCRFNIGRAIDHS